MLEIKGLTKYFGGLAAVSDLDMNVNRGEIVGLIGPNGAGKTTVFNLITGFFSPTRGKVIFEHNDVTGLKPHLIAAKGIVRTFQQTAFLPDLTVLQNIMAASYLNPRSNVLEAILNLPGYRNKEKIALGHALETLKFLGLDAVKDELTQNLPHGYLRLLGIAMAWSARPKLLLCDEPLTGMNSAEIKEALIIIRKICTPETSVLLVEHNMKAVMELCDRIFVLNFGRRIAAGTPDEIKNNQDVIEAYLGVEGNVTQP